MILHDETRGKRARAQVAEVATGKPPEPTTSRLYAR
jgi:hypothetical protein